MTNKTVRKTMTLRTLNPNSSRKIGFFSLISSGKSKQYLYFYLQRREFHISETTKMSWWQQTIPLPFQMAKTTKWDPWGLWIYRTKIFRAAISYDKALSHPKSLSLRVASEQYQAPLTDHTWYWWPRRSMKSTNHQTSIQTQRRNNTQTLSTPSLQ